MAFGFVGVYAIYSGPRGTSDNVLLVALGAAVVPGCSGCEREKKEPTIVYVDDGGARALRRPFDMRHRDSGIPRFHPRVSASSDASEAVME